MIYVRGRVSVGTQLANLAATRYFAKTGEHAFLYIFYSLHIFSLWTSILIINNECGVILNKK